MAGKIRVAKLVRVMETTCDSWEIRAVGRFRRSRASE